MGIIDKKFMRKLIYVFGIIVLACLMLCMSCKKEETQSLPPSITFQSGADLISDDTTVSVSSAFRIGIHAEENPESKSNIRTLKIIRVFNLNTWDTSYNYNDPQVAATFTFYARTTAGKENIRFEVLDNAGDKASIGLFITTQ
jgi:hypothetical protein